MASRGHTGFTVVEVMLFLAISGMLIIVAITGTGTAINQARFTDAARQTQSQIQSYYSNTLSGVTSRTTGLTACNPDDGTVSTPSNPNDRQEAGRSDCILLGTIVIFQKDSTVLRSYPVVGKEPADIDKPENITLSTDKWLVKYNPRVVESMKEEFLLPWGVSIYNACIAKPGAIDLSSDKQFTECQDPPLVEANALLWLQSPKSGQTNVYAFYTNSVSPDFSSGNAIGSYFNLDSDSSANPNKDPVNICIQSASKDKIMLLRAGGTLGSTQTAVTAAVDVADSDKEVACDPSV